jgi:phage terminase small subunit
MRMSAETDARRSRRWGKGHVRSSFRWADSNRPKFGNKPILTPRILIPESGRMPRRISKTIIETHEVIRISTAAPLERYCEACRHEGVFISVGSAVRETGLRLREIFRRIESGAVHCLELPDGMVLVCLTSLVTEPKPDHQQ